MCYKTRHHLLSQQNIWREPNHNRHHNTQCTSIRSKKRARKIAKERQRIKELQATQRIQRNWRLSHARHGLALRFIRRRNLMDRAREHQERLNASLTITLAFRHRTERRNLRCIFQRRRMLMNQERHMNLRNSKAVVLQQAWLACKARYNTPTRLMCRLRIEGRELSRHKEMDEKIIFSAASRVQALWRARQDRRKMQKR